MLEAVIGLLKDYIKELTYRGSKSIIFLGNSLDKYLKNEVTTD